MKSDGEELENYEVDDEDEDYEELASSRRSLT
jgi:hypothetical protein